MKIVKANIDFIYFTPREFSILKGEGALPRPLKFKKLEIFGGGRVISGGPPGLFQGHSLTLTLLGKYKRFKN